MKHVPGSGMTQATKNRILIYNTIGGISQQYRVIREENPKPRQPSSLNAAQALALMASHPQVMANGSVPVHSAVATTAGAVISAPASITIVPTNVTLVVSSAISSFNYHGSSSLANNSLISSSANVIILDSNELSDIVPDVITSV